MRFINIMAGMLFCVCASFGQAHGCSLSATAVNFGSYDSFSILDGTGSVNIMCEPGLLYAVRIDTGANSGGSFMNRRARLSGSAETVSYNLYRDPARTEVWGDGTNNSFIRTGASTGTSQSLTIYGRLPANQNISAGVYNDTLTVTVEW